MMTPIKVVIADDHACFATAEENPFPEKDILVVGELPQ